ncbi:MAG TPA: DUF4296 domain-containing protein [Paludibacter sp.]|nr:DUF4296 domain-containing protein [Paludibacter sp.]
MFYLRNKITPFLISFTIVLFVMISCNNKPDGIINQGKMARFLTDLHKLDGALQVKGLGATQDRENIYYYNSLLKKHGITKAEFDSSLVWYSKNPKKFEKIYSKVLVELQLEDSIHKQKMLAYEDSVMNAVKNIDIWNKNKKYILTKDSARNNIDFKIKGTDLFAQDIYELKFLHRIAPSDSCVNQSAVFRIHYENGLTDSVFTTTHNDSILRRYNLHLVARFKQKIDSLSGSILRSSKYKGVQKAFVDSISLTREYSPVIQKEMQQEIEQNKTGNINIDPKKIRLPHMPKSIPTAKTGKKPNI